RPHRRLPRVGAVPEMARHRRPVLHGASGCRTLHAGGKTRAIESGSSLHPGKRLAHRRRGRSRFSAVGHNRAIRHPPRLHAASRHMFSHAETDPVIDKDEARELEADLRIRLLQHQYRRLQAAEQTLLIVVAGIDGAGKGSAINLLNTWMDPRHVHTLAFGKLNKREAMRPAMWRYWKSLPPKGQTG